MLKDAAPASSPLARTIFVWIASVYATCIITWLIARWIAGDGFWRISLVNSFGYLAFLPLPILFTLALRLRARWMLRGLLTIALVGMAWFVPYFMPKTHPTPAGQTLRILDLNVWGNNHDLSSTESWIRQSEADVVLLQEVSPAYAKDRLPDLQDLYPYQSAQPDNTRWGGNITLSRYPIVSTEYVDLGVPNEPAPERLVLNIHGQKIAVYNVHLAWPSGNADERLTADSFYLRLLFDFDDTKRNQQIASLLDHLKTEPYPSILGGDFNTSDFSATYGKLAAQLHDSFKEAGVGLGGSWPVARARGLPAFIPPLVRLDYLWHNDGLRTVNAWQGPPVGSDHLPLFALLEIATTT